MTIFEFLSVAVSIVLALTLGKLIAATPHVFAARARDVIFCRHTALYNSRMTIINMPTSALCCDGGRTSAEL